MIAIDTTVLLRYLLRDDEARSERARRVIESSERVLITDVVLAETAWTLAGPRYRATRADLIDLINNLLQDANLRFEDDEVVRSALQALSQDGSGLRRRLDRVQCREAVCRRRRVERCLHLR